MTQFLSFSVDELDLSIQANALLKAADILTIRDLVQKTELELSARFTTELIAKGATLPPRVYVSKALNEIKEILLKGGLHLGMSLEDCAAYDADRQEERLAEKWEKAHPYD